MNILHNFFFKIIYLFIYLWLCWVFVSVRGLSLVAASGGHSSSRCADFSLSRPLLLRSTGSRRASSVIVAHGARLLRGMWDLPRPGLEPVSPALAGRLSTTAPPGKPPLGFLRCILPCEIKALRCFCSEETHWFHVSADVPNACEHSAFFTWHI